jgi:transcriptional regulator with XRE-family HTH domain
MLRKRIGLTQAQMADMLCYTRGYYSQIESGRHPMPSGFYLRAVAKMKRHAQNLAKLLDVELKTATCQEGKGYYGT